MPGTTASHERPRAEWMEIPVPALVTEESFARDTGQAPLLQYREALAAKWVERMPDLNPAQELTVFMCSSR